MSDPFLRVQHVGHTFDNGLEVLRNVSLAVPAGGFTALVGTSGVGKSTLLRILAGLLTPTTGNIAVAGEAPQTRAKPIGIVFQRGNLMPWRTAYDNVKLPLELRRATPLSADEQERRIHEILELVGLGGFEQSYPAELSGGMAQRVTLARALVHRPDLLLLDEPFGALDALTREKMWEELLRIRRAVAVTIVMVTHSIPEAVMLSDEVAVLSGSPGALKQVIPIDLPRPRTFAMQGEPAFHACATAVRAAIE